MSVGWRGRPLTTLTPSYLLSFVLWYLGRVQEKLAKQVRWWTFPWEFRKVLETLVDLDFGFLMARKIVFEFRFELMTFRFRETRFNLFAPSVFLMFFPFRT